MSREQYLPKHNYTGNGLLDEYTFDFKIETLDQLLIVVIDDDGEEVERIRGTDTSFLTSVTFDAENGGGTIHLLNVLPASYKLFIIQANDEPTQEFLFRNKASFTLKKFENALDYVIGAVQSLAYKTKNIFRLHETDDELDFNLQMEPLAPLAPDRADRFLQVNADGNRFKLGPTREELTQDVLAQVDTETSGLPEGASEGSYLETVNTGTEEVPVLEPTWQDGVFAGFSVRYGEMFSATGLRDAISKILDIQYAAPTVSLSATPAQSVREKGDTVASVTLTADTTKFDNDITEVRFYRGGVLINTDAAPSADGSANSTYIDGTGFSDTTSYSAQVTDGIGTNSSNTVTYTFVYPYYYGVGAQALTAAQVAALTKDIRTSSSSLLKSFVTTSGQVYYFAYPASYGALTSILDINGFETFPSWTLRTENITGLDGNAVSYRIYEFNLPQGAGSMDFTFIR